MTNQIKDEYNHDWFRPQGDTLMYLDFQVFNCLFLNNTHTEGTIEVISYNIKPKVTGGFSYMISLLFLYVFILYYTIFACCIEISCMFMVKLERFSCILRHDMECIVDSN